MHKRTYKEGREYLAQAKEFARAVIAEQAMLPTRIQYIDGGYNSQLVTRAAKVIDQIEALEFTLECVEDDQKLKENKDELPF